MPTKIKTSSLKKSTTSSVAKKSVLKPVALKSLALKSILKKTSSPKKKSVSKSKQHTRKRTGSLVVDEMLMKPAAPMALSLGVESETVVHHCVNCEHIPFSLPNVIKVFSVLILILSASLLIQMGQIDLAHLISLASPHAFAATVGFTR